MTVTDTVPEITVPEPAPVFDAAALADMTPAQLIALMIEHEDRVPRNVIDACVRLGDAMADALAPWAARHYGEDYTPGHWWLRLHAVMILGLIPGEPAANALLVFIRGMCNEKDENLQEWFAGYWPALTRNKPAALLEQLRSLIADRRIGWYLRANLHDAVLAFAHREGEAALDAALDWAAQIAVDENEDMDMRLLAAGHLLDFPRERHRALLEQLLPIQPRLGKHFDRQDIEQAYARGEDRPEWARFDNPWHFYETQVIEARQQRWAEEDARDAAYLDDELLIEIDEPYVRATPKIGRNDPCPCGSGKKYKKCCGAK